MLGFPGGTSGKEPTCQCKRHKRHGFYPCIQKIHRRRAWQLTRVFLPGESYGQRNLVGCIPWDHKELGITKWVSTYTHKLRSLIDKLPTSSWQRQDVVIHQKNILSLHLSSKFLSVKNNNCNIWHLLSVYYVKNYCVLHIYLI